MDAMKKARNSNMSPDEKWILVNFIEKYIDVVEDKQITAVTTAKKLEIWGKLTEEYNTRSGQTARTKENLKGVWENLKKAARRSAADTRTDLVQTGGGLPKRRREDPLLDKVFRLVGTSGSGSPSAFGFDSLPECKPEFISVPQYEEFATAVASTSSNHSASLLSQDAEMEQYEICDEGLNAADANWDSWAPEAGSVRTAKDERQACSRNATAEPSASELQRCKIDLIRCQQQLAEEERLEARQLHRIKRKVEEEKLLAERSRKLVEEERLKQERIKTEMLRLELEEAKRRRQL